MTASRPNSGRKRRTRKHAVEPDAVNAATGTRSSELQLRLVSQALNVLGTLPKGEAADGAIKATLDALAGINPRDELEGMLATQMVSVHDTTMECLRRAAHPDQTFAGRDMNLKHAAKLLQIYARQVEALDKHRGKGQQKITVEHVTVEAGGQAIVGSVQAGEQGKPPAITDERAGEPLSRILCKEPGQS